MTGTKRNLILGFCTNYKFEAIEPFVASALDIGGDVRLCLFTHGLDERFNSVAARHAIRLEDAEPYLAMGFHAQNARYFAYQRFLEENRDDYDHVLLTDVRDVFFQGDPFAVPLPKPVCFSLEDTKIMWETVNQGWLRDIYGEDILASVAKNHVACSGTTLGTTAGIEIYLDVICKELEDRTFDRMGVYDQGIHNYIVWKLQPDWGWIDEADSIVNTVGCTSPERIKIIDDVAVIDGTVPAVVHQWDRHASLRTHIETSDRFEVRSAVPALGARPDAPTAIPQDSCFEPASEIVEIEGALLTRTSFSMPHAPWRPATIDASPVMGPRLAELVATGCALEIIEIAPRAFLRRVPFFARDDIDPAKAPYGHFLSDGTLDGIHTTDPLVCARFRDMAVLGCDGVVMSGGLIIADTANQITLWAPDAAVAAFDPYTMVALKRPLPVTRYVEDVPALVGYSPAWRNYAHWLQETLPILTTYLALRERVPALRLVMPVLRVGSFQQQTLDLLGIGPEWVIAVPPDAAVWFADGYVMTKPDLWTVQPTVIDAANLLAERAMALAVIKSRPERVYLHRQSGVREVGNFEALRTLLDRYGFSVIVPENMTLVEQVATMRAARIVIAAHGAGLGNIIFCRPDASVLELFNEACVQPAFWGLASQAGLRFGFSIGQHVPTATFPELGWNSSYDVPLDRLEMAIEAMVGTFGAEQTNLNNSGIAESARPSASSHPRPGTSETVSIVGDHNYQILTCAEKVAETGDVDCTLHMLRRLSLFDFGLLLLRMPSAELPALSVILPRMASMEIQTAWTGASGFDLYRQTQEFAHCVQFHHQRHVGGSLNNKRILDFGCGYGHLLRMMLYFTDPTNLFGVDTSDRSLEICQKDGLLCHLRQSGYHPEALPVDGTLFDMIYAYSVFTQTSERATRAALAALRRCIKPNGVLILTVRPVEFWNQDFFENRPGFNHAALMAAQWAHGFSFQPAGMVTIDGDDAVGDTVIAPWWFRTNAPGWQLVETDRRIDLDQIILILTPC